MRVSIILELDHFNKTASLLGEHQKEKLNAELSRFNLSVYKIDTTDVKHDRRLHKAVCVRLKDFDLPDVLQTMEASTKSSTVKRIFGILKQERMQGSMEGFLNGVVDCINDSGLAADILNDYFRHSKNKILNRVRVNYALIKM